MGRNNFIEEDFMNREDEIADRINKIIDIWLKGYNFESFIKAMRELNDIMPGIYIVAFPFALNAMGYLSGRYSFSKFIQLLMEQASIIDQAKDDFFKELGV